MLPPGPRTPALWQTIQTISHPRDYMREVQRRYGDVVRFRTLIGKGIAVCDPTLAREVFAVPGDRFITPTVMGNLFGARAVIATAGTTHKKQRKLLNPPFHGPRIKAMLGTMEQVIDKHLTRMGVTRGAFAMTDISQALTLDVILETVFGASFGSGKDERAERGRALLRAIIDGFDPMLVTSPRFHRPWVPAWRRHTRARAAFDRWVVELLAERRGQAEPGADLLGLFVAARYDDGAPMSDGEIADHLVTLLLAGHETSATAIAWATYWLLREPSVLAKLRAELDGLGPSPSPEALVRLPYLGAVVSESLRIEPIVTDVLRTCVEPVRVGPWEVPAGEIIAVMLGAILWDARIFPEPEKFRPERFLERSFHAGEFLPFGGGQRRCLGAAFAEAELALAVAAIAQRWELELATDRPERSVRKNITMGPRHGVQVRVRGPRRSTEHTPPRSAVA